jgi:hypothetical protein
MLKSKLAIKQWLNRVGVSSYTVHDDLTVDVNGNVSLSTSGLNEIPVQFGVVNGNFSVFGCNLKSLKGSPRKVAGHFDCSYNKLTTLEYSPIQVLGSFFCYSNKLTTLFGCPEEIGKDFVSMKNKIRTLKYSPKIVRGNFRISDNYLETFNELNCDIGGYFFHEVDSLENSLEQFKDLYEINRLPSTTYQLTLSQQKLELFQQERLLRVELPINEAKTPKKIKI